MQQVERKKSETPDKRGLQNFKSRLFWNQHFVQKLERDLNYEKLDLNWGFRVMEKPINNEYISAWKEGRTGYPLIDASMRCVIQTGYLNFRMRAMLVSFFTHHLWQPWQEGVNYLACQFLDYDPGIHFPQFQMQAGVVGTHIFRIYNPVKQAEDHDADGVFILKWIPELKVLPKPLFISPWKLTRLEQSFYDFQLGRDYPFPIVNHLEMAKKAKIMLTECLKSDLTKRETSRILNLHHRRESSKNK